MANKKKKIDKYARRRLVLKIILLIIVFILIKLIFFRAPKNYYEETVLIIGDKIEQLDNSIIVDSLENIYISYNDIKNIYDENIYYDEVNKKLITTYNKHIALLNLDTKSIVINDAESSIKGELKYMEDKLYLPFSDMSLVYDFEYKYCKETNTVILDSISKKKSMAKVLKDTTVKKGTGLFSKKLKKLNENDSVVVLDANQKKYKVRTMDGIIGYVDSKKLDKLNVVREDMKDSKIENVNILLDYSRN